jgi:hypothetical protein
MHADQTIEAMGRGSERKRRIRHTAKKILGNRMDWMNRRVKTKKGFKLFYV